MCIAGLCEEDLCANVDCDDGNDCTVDSCDPSNGTCVSILICEDIDPPALTAFDIVPQSVDLTGGPAEVTFTWSLTDPSGIGANAIEMESPTAGQFIGCSPTLLSGDQFDGVWTCTDTFDQGAEGGVWEVSTLRFSDSLGNDARFFGADLELLGFPGYVDVTYGP